MVCLLLLVQFSTSIFAVCVVVMTNGSAGAGMVVIYSYTSAGGMVVMIWYISRRLVLLRYGTAGVWYAHDMVHQQKVGDVTDMV